MTPTATPDAAPHSGRRRALAMLAQAGMFVFGIVMALVGAVVPVLSGDLALSLGDVGTLFLVMNFGMLVASLAIGLVMDRWGLKLPIALGAVLVAAGLVLTGTAARFGPLLIAVAALGLGGGALNAATNTLVADLDEDPARKAAALNLLGVFFGFGALILPFSVGALTERFGIAPLLFTGAGLCAVVALASGALRFPAPKQLHGWPVRDMPRFLRLPAVRALALLLFFESGNEFLIGGYIATFLTRSAAVPVATASYWLAGFWASIMAARLVLSRMLLHVTAPAVVLGGAIVSAAGAALVASATTPAMAAAGTLVTGFALGGIFPSVLGFTGARFPDHSGTVFGILFTIALCGGMTIPWLAGHLAEAAGLRSVFVLAALNFGAVAALMALARRS